MGWRLGIYLWCLSCCMVWGLGFWITGLECFKCGGFTPQIPKPPNPRFQIKSMRRGWGIPHLSSPGESPVVVIQVGCRDFPCSKRGCVFGTRTSLKFSTRTPQTYPITLALSQVNSVSPSRQVPTYFPPKDVTKLTDASTLTDPSILTDVYHSPRRS